MESSVRWIGVFAFAIGTHGKWSHGRFGAIIKNIFYDREARSAVGAVDEWITIAPIGRVEEFAQAIVADGDIGRDGLKAESMDSEWRMSNERKPLIDRKETVNSSMRESGGASSRNDFIKESSVSFSPSTSMSTPADVFFTQPFKLSRVARL